MKGWTGAGHASDTDSVSGSSCRSHESSPTTSPYSRRHRPLVASNSMNELAEADRDAQFDSSKFFLFHGRKKATINQQFPKGSPTGPVR